MFVVVKALSLLYELEFGDGVAVPVNLYRDLAKRIQGNYYGGVNKAKEFRKAYPSLFH